MAEALGMLLFDPLDSIIDQEISDGSDALWNSSDADDDEVRRGKAFAVGTYLCYYGTMRHTLVLQLRWVVLLNTKIFYPMIEQLAEFLCPILPHLVCTYSRGGWAGVGSPYLRAYPLVKQMARIEAFCMNLKPASGTRSETMYLVWV